VLVFVFVCFVKTVKSKVNVFLASSFFFFIVKSHNKATASIFGSGAFLNFSLRHILALHYFSPLVFNHLLLFHILSLVLDCLLSLLQLLSLVSIFSSSSPSSFSCRP